MGRRTPQTSPPSIFSFRHLLRHVGIYTISNVVNRALPFLLLPILTLYLAPAEYAVFVLFQVIMNFVLPFIGVNGEAAVARAMVVTEDREALAGYVSTMVWSICLMGAVVLTGSLVLGPPVARFLDFPAAWLPLVILVGLAESIKLILIAIWQIQKQPGNVLRFTGAQTVVRFVASVLPVMVASNPLAGLIWGYALSMVAFGLVSPVLLIRQGLLQWRFETVALRQFLGYGVPLIPHRTGAWFQGMADRIVITRLAGLGQMGVYSVGYSVGMVVGVIQDAVNRAWVPHFFEGLNRRDDDTDTRIVAIIYGYAIALLLVAGTLALLAPLIFQLLGDRFRTAQGFVVWIAAAYALNGLYKMFANFVFFSERTIIISAITVAVGLLNLALSIALVPHVGAVGAAYAAVVSQLLMCTCAWLAAEHIYPMPWRRGLHYMFRRFRGTVPQ